jgi:HSP20 family protein
MAKEVSPSRRRRRGMIPTERNLFSSLHEEIDRLLEDVFEGRRLPVLSGMPTVAEVVPDVDVAETEKEIHITAELPGVDEKDVEVTLADGLLTIRGEKRTEKEEKDKQFQRTERTYGAFSRTLSLPADVDEDKVSATFRNGVLKVTAAKTKAARTPVRKVAIKSS